MTGRTGPSTTTPIPDCQAIKLQQSRWKTPGLYGSEYSTQHPGAQSRALTAPLGRPTIAPIPVCQTLQFLRLQLTETEASGLGLKAVAWRTLTAQTGQSTLMLVVRLIAPGRKAIASTVSRSQVMALSGLVLHSVWRSSMAQSGPFTVFRIVQMRLPWMAMTTSGLAIGVVKVSVPSGAAMITRSPKTPIG